MILTHDAPNSFQLWRPSDEVGGKASSLPAHATKRKLTYPEFLDILVLLGEAMYGRKARRHGLSRASPPVTATDCFQQACMMRCAQHFISRSTRAGDGHTRASCTATLGPEIATIIQIRRYGAIWGTSV